MKVNFHSHTGYCPHATGSVDDYVREAIRNGYEEIGFSDHCPWPGLFDRFPAMRMRDEDFPRYIEDVQRARETYAGKIRIYTGLECEIFPDRMSWLEDTMGRYDMDYVIFGNHHTFMRGDEHPYIPVVVRETNSLEMAWESMEAGMDSGIFSCVAHPDVFVRYLDEITPECEELFTAICRKAAAKNLPLEFNLLGLRVNDQEGREGYPRKRFWEIAAREGAPCVIGLDAHKPEDYTLQEENLTRARKYLNSLGLEPLDKLPMRRGDDR